MRILSLEYPFSSRTFFVRSDDDCDAVVYQLLTEELGRSILQDRFLTIPPEEPVVPRDLIPSVKSEASRARLLEEWDEYDKNIKQYDDSQALYKQLLGDIASENATGFYNKYRHLFSYKLRFLEVEYPKWVRGRTFADDLANAKLVLKRIEDLVRADWEFHDYPTGAQRDVKSLMEALSSLVGPSP